MPQTKTAPYGSWKSPITSELIVSKSIRLGAAFGVGEAVYWSEARPLEGGRNVLVRQGADGKVTDITPPGFNLRSTVHEYGGRCVVVDDDKVYFSNFADQRIYIQVLDPSGQGVGAPRALTPESAWRYADPLVHSLTGRLICVREDHTDPQRECLNSLVSINLQDGADQVVLAQGHDFYASPRLSPDGKALAWLTWDHPNMPWDGSQLWVAEFQADGSLGPVRLVAGGQEESIFQPEWSPDGRLYFVSDRSGWWNLYRCSPAGGEVCPQAEALYPMDAEFGLPLWNFGMKSYDFVSAESIICLYTRNGESVLAILDLRTRQLEPIPTPYSEFSSPSVSHGRLLLNAGSPTRPSCIVSLDLETHTFQILRCSSDLQVEAGYLSIPQMIEFPTENGLNAFGYYYPPQNRDFAALEGELPPLLVLSHGGPTGSTSRTLSLTIQYWTSRGFAVLDVNYGGSTGYGREYRQRLNGNWGVVDVDDCCNGARFLAAQGLVDGERLAIRGGSAGGYTTLAALTFRQVFKAGASHYGIGDLETLAADTHKFESRYLDRLVGPYPGRKDLYVQRSPIHFVERIACPLILFQGLEDKVVPPSQSQAMFDAVKARGLPVAYITYAGEQHGFRKAENIKHSLDSELYFYGKVFGFELADDVQPVEIENI
jgi:dipeptidyl aminopeptidase/acylaminoacyl peptidase